MFKPPIGRLFYYQNALPLSGRPCCFDNRSVHQRNQRFCLACLKRPSSCRVTRNLRRNTSVIVIETRLQTAFGSVFPAIYARKGYALGRFPSLRFLPDACALPDRERERPWRISLHRSSSRRSPDLRRESPPLPARLTSSMPSMASCGAYHDLAAAWHAHLHDHPHRLHPAQDRHRHQAVRHQG